MDKKTYKKPVSRIVVFDTDDILRMYFGAASLEQPIGLDEGNFVGNFVPEGNNDDNIYSKDGNSWEMEW